MQPLQATILACFAVFAAQSAHAQQEFRVVENGVLDPALGWIQGGEWTQGDSYIERQGTNHFLWSHVVVGPGDFRVSAELTLHDMANPETGQGSAASLRFDDLLRATSNNFGFIGGGGQLFAEGGFFPAFQDLGPTPLPEGERFRVDFIREGDVYRFLLDGEEWLSTPVPDEDPSFDRRSGYYQVALRPWRSRMQVHEFSIVTQSGLPEPLTEEVVFVENGIPLKTIEIGEPWIYSDTEAYNAFDPGNFAFGDRMIAGENVRIDANLVIRDLDGSATSFTINGSQQFGFAGGTNNMFIEGGLFGGNQTLGPTVVEEGVPFDFSMIRSGSDLLFLINGVEVGRGTFTGGETLGFAGFRPHRAWMFIHSFSVKPYVEELIWPSVARRLPGEFFTAGQTLTGAQIRAAAPAGESVSVLITETLPAGWIASNLDATMGAASFSNGAITWNLEDASDSATLTFDLTAPSEPSLRNEFSGVVEQSGQARLIDGQTLLLHKAGEGVITVVANGVLQPLAAQVGEPWIEIAGAADNAGTGRFLYGDIAIADGDFVITADMTLFDLGATAATLAIDGLNGPGGQFGLDGGENRIFTEGGFFGGALQFHGPRPFGDGERITAQLVREGNDISGSIGDEVYFSLENPGVAFRAGVRPWRSRMHVHNFSVEIVPGTSVDL